MKTQMIRTIYASDLKSRAVLVMNYLIFRANREGTCFPAIKTIAKECHIGVNTVKRALDDLVKAGYIHKQPRFLEAKNGAQTSNLYTLAGKMLAATDMDQTETGVDSQAAPAGCREDDYIARESFASMAECVASGTTYSQPSSQASHTIGGPQRQEFDPASREEPGSFLVCPPTGLPSGPI